MSENKFDKEKIDVIHNDVLPKTFMAFDNEKVYDIRQKRNAWWKCPKCGGNLIERTGRYGAFLGCSNYPYCRFTHKME